MATLYTPTLTYDPVIDLDGSRATHYQIGSPTGDEFIYEAIYTYGRINAPPWRSSSVRLLSWFFTTPPDRK